MIKEFSVRPKPKNNNARIAFLITVLLSAAGFVTYFFMDRYKGVVGMAALLLLVTALLFYTKYISPVFSYDITFDSANTPVFVVRQIVGKRITTLCRLDLADITEICKEGKKERKAHKAEKGVKRYIYAPTLFPPEVFRLSVKSMYERAEVIIECSDEFAALISEYSTEARLTDRDTE